MGLYVILFAAVVGLLSGCQPEAGESPAPPRVLTVETRPVAWREAIEREARFFGLVEARQTSELAFELSGTVDRIFVREGDSVEAGQKLAELDEERLLSRIAAREAAVNEARASLELADATYRRLERLVSADAASEQEFDEAKQARDVARATITRMQAEVEALRVDLKKSTLHAPYDGVIVRRRLDEGASIGPARAVLSIMEKGHLEARVGVNPEAARALAIGEAFDLVAPGQGERRYTATVARIIPRRDQSLRTIDVLFAMDAGETGLRPGDPVEARIPMPETAAGFWVPRSALTENVRGLWALYFVTPEAAGDPVAERRPAEVLYFENERAYVHAPAAEGDRMVVSGLHRLAPGQRVNPVAERGE